MSFNVSFMARYGTIIGLRVNENISDCRTIILPILLGICILGDKTYWVPYNFDMFKGPCDL